MNKIIFSILFTLISYGVSSQNADIDILKQINQGKSVAMDKFCQALSNSVAPIAIATPAYFIVTAIKKKDSSSIAKAVFFTSSLVVATVIANVTKIAVQRDRPYETYSFIEQKTSVYGYSFPSSHTSNAFQLATSLTIVYPKWYVVAPSYLWASAVGYSRMELGVHYPSDVLAGAIIGSGSALLSHKLTKWLNKKRKR
jgi:membrane-associated phospholipid phosphatase